MKSSHRRIRTSVWTAAFLGAAVVSLSAAAAAASQAPAGPAFLKGRVHDLARPNAGPEERFAAAKAEAAKSGANKTFFAAAMFPAASKIHYDRHGGGDEPYSVSVDATRIEISEKSGGGWSVSDGDNAGKPAPAVWLLLCDGKTGVLIDAAVLDPERTYEFSGPPVYWLGNAAGGESLTFIEKLFRANPDSDIQEKILFLISCHAEPRVYDILHKIALEDRDTEVRRSAVFWLGNIGDARSLAGLKEIFRKDHDPEIREHVIFALSLRKEKEAVVEMIRIAREDGDDSVREKAVFWLGQKASAECVKALKDVILSPTENDQLKEQAVFAISQLPNDKAVPMLLDIAKTHKNASVRKKAIFWLGQTGDPAALKFFEEILLKK
ncbi:MAG: HEAT repeat domain-containing protein [Candidatus Aminicenantes bacterium]|nr:HEAT repeat domain-containing protein [Candidatus Aminicenantes bacterium]